MFVETGAPQVTGARSGVQWGAADVTDQLKSRHQ
jgi:hypothetical protein